MDNRARSCDSLNRREQLPESLLAIASRVNYNWHMYSLYVIEWKMVNIHLLASCIENVFQQKYYLRIYDNIFACDNPQMLNFTQYALYAIV